MGYSSIISLMFFYNATFHTLPILYILLLLLFRFHTPIKTDYSQNTSTVDFFVIFRQIMFDVKLVVLLLMVIMTWQIRFIIFLLFHPSLLIIPSKYTNTSICSIIWFSLCFIFTLILFSFSCYLIFIYFFWLNT